MFLIGGGGDSAHNNFTCNVAWHTPEMLHRGTLVTLMSSMRFHDDWPCNCNLRRTRHLGSELKTSENIGFLS